MVCSNCIPNTIIVSLVGVYEIDIYVILQLFIKILCDVGLKGKRSFFAGAVIVPIIVVYPLLM